MNIVTAAAIIRDERVLIAQRKADSHMGCRWEFPGGKLEPGETSEECIVREIKEEMDIDIEVIDIYKVVKFQYKEKEILLLCYLCKILKGEGKPIECNDFKWVKKNELSGFDFVPADLPIIEKLTKDKRL